MSHGHSIGASVRSPSAAAANSPAFQGQHSWRRLDPDLRLELVARALRGGDGLIDLYPLAL